MNDNDIAKDETGVERVTVRLDTIIEKEYEDGSALVDLMGTSAIVSPDDWERFEGGDNDD